MILLVGSKVSIFLSKSIASGLAPLNIVLKSLPFLFGRLYMNSLFLGIVICSTKSSYGLPMRSVINYICSSSEVAGRRGFLVINSASIHPTDHTSMAVLYLFQERITSGALYHLVAI